MWVFLPRSYKELFPQASTSGIAENVGIEENFRAFSRVSYVTHWFLENKITVDFHVICWGHCFHPEDVLRNTRKVGIKSASWYIYMRFQNFFSSFYFSFDLNSQSTRYANKFQANCYPRRAWNWHFGFIAPSKNMLYTEAGWYSIDNVVSIFNYKTLFFFF